MTKGKGKRIVIALFVGVLVLACLFCAKKWQENHEGWKVTQYACASGSQAMFYSLVNRRDGTVILIDSGNPQNAEQVSEVIKQNGGHVKAWFLTHYHMDHIGAFNEVWEQWKDNIETIYVTPLPYEVFEPRAHEWDTPEVFARFLELTQNNTNIVALHRGDSFDIDGLGIQVFNAYDEFVEQYATDVANDSSLVLKFSGKENSFLFLGDLSRAGVPLGEFILEQFGVENVRADFVQPGHHGNWGLPIEFYERLQPKEMFFDAPEWLMTGEQFDARYLEAWCKENGIITHDYREGPSTVILK